MLILFVRNYLAKGEADMKSGSVDMNKSLFPRLQGMTMVAMMVLTLASGVVLADDESKKDDFASFKIWNTELSADGKPVEVTGITKDTERKVSVSALASKDFAKVAEFVEMNHDNARKWVEAIHGGLRKLISKDLKSSDEVVGKKVGEYMKSLVAKLKDEKLEDKLFGGKDRREQLLKLTQRIADLKPEELAKLLKKAGTDKSGAKDKEESLLEFLKLVFDEKTLEELKLTLTAPEEKKPEGPSVSETDKDKTKKPENRLTQEAPTTGNKPEEVVTPPVTTPPPSPRVGEQNLDERAREICDKIDAARKAAEKSALDALQALRNRQLAPSADKALAAAPKQNPEDAILKALQDQIAANEEEAAPQAAQNQTPAQQPPVAQNDSQRGQNQLPTPPPAQQPTPQAIPPLNTQVAQTAPVEDAELEKTPSVGREALASATNTAAAVEPLTQLKAPVAAQPIGWNPTLTAQQNVANINAYFDQQQQYVNSFKQSVESGLNLVQAEKSNLAIEMNNVSEAADKLAEKEIDPKYNKNVKTAQAELDQAKAALKNAETSYSQLQGGDQSNPGFGAQLSSIQQQASQAASQVAALQTKLSNAEESKSAAIKAKKAADEGLQKRLAKMAKQKSILDTREKTLQDRQQGINDTMAKNEQSRQTSINSGATQNQLASSGNVNTISSFSPNASRRGGAVGGLSGAVINNQSTIPQTGARGSLGNTF